MRLNDKVAMITGAASGIGRATAITYAKEGAKLILVDLNEQMLEETLCLTGLDPDSVFLQKIDVAKFLDLEKLVDLGLKRFGRIDILANIAGIFVGKNLMDHTLEDWNRVISINLTGVFNCIKAVAPIMIKQKYGKIINMGSIAGLVGLEWTSYTASKAGVVNMSRGLALELGPNNINVNAICPGIIQTAMTPSADLKDYLIKIPQGRLGKPEDVAGAAVFLASDEASFINGTTLVIDGGATGSYRSH